MTKRFTGNELFKLRNLIPIDGLIEKNLMIPSKLSEGYFRFLCPLCNEFQTATNPKTNLARCFLCEKNFNPIDMVMTCRQVSFVESVKYLQAAYRQVISDYQNPEEPEKTKLACHSKNLEAICKNLLKPIS